MNGFVLVLVTATLGVDYGWQPSSDGRLEYIIQVEPVTLIALREGQEVLSQIDPYVKNVRRFRIRVGSDLVPRVGSRPRENDYGSTPTKPLPSEAGVSYGWQPFEAQSLEFIVQISPERLVLLKNGEEIVGEIPQEIQSVGRFRVRSASDQLPRQGLAPAAGQSSGVALASANQPSNSSQPTAQPSQAPRFTAASPTGQNGGGTLLGTAAGAANTAGQNTTPQQGVSPTVGGPPRLGASTGAQPAAQGYTLPSGYTLGAAQTQPPGGQTVYSGQATLGGAASVDVAEQSDSRFIYQQTRGQYGAIANTPLTQHMTAGQDAAGQVGGWQQPAVQPVAQPSYPAGQLAIQTIQPQAPTVANNTGGWSGAAGNAQDWPPRLREDPPNTAQTNQGGYGGWDSRPTASSPQGNFATQYGGAQPTASHEYLTPAGGPVYSSNSPAAYPPAGQDPGIASRPPGATGGGFSPYSSPTFQASSGQTRVPAPSTTNASNRGLGSDLDWPLNTVSFGVTSQNKANPLDFWNSLDETANDPSLAYLHNGGGSAEEAWWPLTLAMLALFASMGGNLYMGWIAADVYRKYLDVATDEYDDDDDEQPRRSRDGNTEDAEEDGWGGRRRRRERTAVGSDYS